jgi:diguanylate cyclase (GGDEF)-like protein
MKNLLDAANRAGLGFEDGELVIAFSGGGELAGLLMVFFKNTFPTDADTATPVLQSASRLVSLASDHWDMHERLVFDARHDALTGLPNRTLAEDRLEQALARAQRRRQIFAVICIDLDGFKGINDNLGHHAGDEVLRVVGVRLRARTRNSDTLARIGGDEFLAIIEDCLDDAAAQAVADSLISALQEPIAIEGTTVAISGSIGIAMYPADGKQASELERNADQAMYRAKAHGGGQTCFWSREPAPAAKAVTKSTSSSG